MRGDQNSNRYDAIARVGATVHSQADYLRHARLKAPE